jgi:hypothetical protein
VYLARIFNQVLVSALASQILRRRVTGNEIFVDCEFGSTRVSCAACDGE